MAFRLRRGTDTERQSVVFAEGELVYTTDTKELYVGDGTTLGGIRITGSVEDSPIALTRDLDLNSFNIVGSGDVNIDGFVTASHFYGNGAGLTNIPALNVNDGATYQISIAGADSSIIVDSSTSTVQGHLIGELTGSVFDTTNNILLDNDLLKYYGSVYAADETPIIESNTKTLYGTFIGNIQCADSTLAFNYATGDISAAALYAHDIHTSIINTSLLEITPETGNSSVTLLNLNATDERSILKFTRNSASNISNADLLYGSIFFERNDSGPALTTGIIAGGKTGLFFLSDAAGAFPESATISHLSSNGNFGIGLFVPTEKLSVSGNAKVTGFVQFGSLTTTQRNALTPANGMVIYNTTDNKFQGYQNGGWINLDTGSAA